MVDKAVKREIAQKLIKAKEFLYTQYPFFGSLLMHLHFELEEDCSTAYTNMKSIVFDPEFAIRLDEQELLFVLKHEVLHIVLKHCIRGKGLNQEVYNYACDILVNSYLMQVMGIEEFQVDGKEVIHLAPNGREGYHYSAEQLYQMLLDDCDSTNALDNTSIKIDISKMGERFDSHQRWETINTYSPIFDKWDSYIKESLTKYMSEISYLPPELRELERSINHRPKIRWKTELFDFVKILEAEQDFNYRPPDRRCSEWDIILPGLNDTETYVYEDLLFFFDASGSVSARQLAIFFEELKSALKQIRGLKGSLSFFDTRVTDPVPFDSVKSLEKIRPKGGGGTSFRAVFRYVDENMKRNPPAAIIILTDGYGKFPDKKAANEIPVLWVIKGKEIKAPWGKTIHIN